jgi:hypothetical protein
MINKTFLVPKSRRAPDVDPYQNPKLSFIYGPCGSGKSVLLLNLLDHLEKLHDFDEALFVTGNGRDNLLDSIEMPKTTNPSDLSTWITKVSQPSDEPRYNLLILDDCIGNPDFNIFTNRSEFVKFILSHRHLGKVVKNGVERGGTWIIMTSQRYASSFSPAVKDQINIFFVFQPRTQPELKAVMAIGDDPTRMKKAMALLKMEGKYNFLYINKDFTPYRYSIGFKDEIKLD